MISGTDSSDAILSLADLLFIDEVCDRFEAAWRPASGPNSPRSWAPVPGGHEPGSSGSY